MSTVDFDTSREYAVSLDTRDELSNLRKEFHIPTRDQLKNRSLSSLEEASTTESASPDDLAIYLCGNSLGLQPRRTQRRLQQYLTTWATQGVFGHFKPLEDSPLPTWLDVDECASQCIAPIVGARPAEVAVMQTLTANLHLLMCAFYKPDPNGRHKIIIEGGAFPSDHFAAESQILHHGLSPPMSLVTIKPSSAAESTITTEEILALISRHQNDTAILLLPGIQYYTGQLFDIKLITRHARAAGIFVIWDLAHAVGNVPLQLHDWGVDAAVWCSYKYLNSGPGCAGGLFVHERISTVKLSDQSQSREGTKKEKYDFPNRLSGWWGSSKSSRFAMDNQFVPIAGAAGFQLSNPSILDLTSVTSSLEIFAQAGGMSALRARSLRLTAYLSSLLSSLPSSISKHFKTITPADPEQRGAQLSLRLEEGLLDVVMHELEERAVVVDERRPDVIRVAPAPLYNSFEDCWRFVSALEEALEVAVAARDQGRNVQGTRELEQTT